MSLVKMMCFIVVLLVFSSGSRIEAKDQLMNFMDPPCKTYYDCPPCQCRNVKCPCCLCINYKCLCG
ncbi:hypothetical protein Lalb_Chr03g0032711 [Lupinus albus]|uniref:Late nodulin n=1 Tax=Lupinus albus TaxID=3870 RepID=A0A6A4QT00_LUPAL|nr:hypothetical protein Lalb_Chr03g0032711 [Lupinus albus]